MVKYTTIEKGEIVTKDLSKEEFITLMGKLSKIAKKRKRDKLIKSNITISYICLICSFRVFLGFIYWKTSAFLEVIFKSIC